MATTYDLHLRGTVGDWDFDSSYVDYVISKTTGSPLSVLISSLGGSLGTALQVAAAFSRHGDVTVHYVGMNASAATIAGMGAKRITMDASALWLVHQTSYVLDIWKQHNADDMATLIAELESRKKDLETFDRSISAFYARRCRKTPQELAALMKEERWLTAQEALEWGFIDEVTDSCPGAKAEVPRSVVLAMKEAGLPLPPKMRGASLADRLADAVGRALKAVGLAPAAPEAPEAQEEAPEAPEAQEEAPQNQHSVDGRQAEITESPETPDNMAETTIQAEAPAANANADLAARLAAAEARIAELEKAPGDDTSKVIDNAGAAAPAASAHGIDRWAKDTADAKALFDSLP